MEIVDTSESDPPEPEEKGASALEVLRFVFGYWRQTPLRFAAMLLGTATGVLLEVQIPQLSANVVLMTERVLSGRAASDAAWHAAGWLLTFFAATYVVKQLYIRNWMYLATEIMQKLLVDGFAKVQRFSLEWHTNHFAGSTQRKITRGMWGYDHFADALVLDLGPAFALLMGFTVSMAWKDPALGAYFGGSVTVFVVVSILVSVRYVAPANVFSNLADTAVSGSLADAITCNAVVKSFGAESREDARFFATSRSWRIRSRRAWLRSMDAGAVQSVLLLVMLGGLLVLVLVRTTDAGGRVEGAVYIITTYLLVQGYLRNIGSTVRHAQKAINDLEDLVLFAKAEPRVKDAVEAPLFRPGPGAIAFEGVTFGYRNQPQPVFRDLNVRIRPGEKIALVGESGSGKSTFAKLLQRLYDVNRGRVLVDGQDVRAVRQASLRRAISVVPQEPILFHRSLAENICYARPDASEEEMKRAAEQASADAFIARLERGYDTLVGERGVKLSGGERQRVAIARAILADSPILILDEATSSLDSVTEHLIQRALTMLMRGRTSVVIAHRLSTIRRVDRILVFDHGCIVEEGSHEELVARPGGRYRELVRMQAFSGSEAFVEGTAGIGGPDGFASDGAGEGDRDGYGPYKSSASGGAVPAGHKTS